MFKIYNFKVLVFGKLANKMDIHYWNWITSCLEALKAPYFNARSTIPGLYFQNFLTDTKTLFDVYILNFHNIESSQLIVFFIKIKLISDKKYIGSTLSSAHHHFFNSLRVNIYTINCMWSLNGFPWIMQFLLISAANISTSYFVSLISIFTVIIPFLTMIYWVLTLVISPEGQEVFSSTLSGQL